MAGRHVPDIPAPSAISSDVFAECHQLKEKHKAEEREFDTWVLTARRHLFERQANEQAEFWAARSHVSQFQVPQKTLETLASQPAIPPSQQSAAVTPMYMPNMPSGSLTNGLQKSTTNVESPSATQAKPGQGAAPTSTRSPSKSSSQMKVTKKPQSQSTPNSQPKHTPRPAPVEVIELSSDSDEEPPPPRPKGLTTPRKSVAAPSTPQGKFTPTVPSAALSFFGNGNGNRVKALNTQIKVEGQSDGRSHTSSTTTATAGAADSTSSPKVPLHSSPQNPVSIKSSLNTSSKPIPSDRQTNFSHDALVKQRNDRTSILKNLASIPNDPLLHSFQQQQKDGAFVNKILHNRRAQNWAPELGRVFQQQDDVAINNTPPKATALDLPSQARSPTFKVPLLPGRTTNQHVTTSERTRREGTVTSRGSSQNAAQSSKTLNKLRTSREPSAASTQTSQTSFTVQSQVSPTHKRKTQYSVSDESDGGVGDEFTPSSDEEELSVLTKHTLSPTKKVKTARGTAFAKPTIKKNTFGFISAAVKLQSSSVLSPSVQTASHLRNKSGGSANKSSRGIVQTITRERRAKLLARAKIDQFAQEAAEYRNDEDIREAEEKEQRLRGTVHAAEELDVGNRLRRLSLTPAPASTGSATTRLETVGADDKTSDRRREDSVYSHAKWSADRLGGDRHISKSLAGSERGRGDEESDSELDLSQWRFHDGRIYARVEEIDLTESG
ncbi:sister chromatid cohesion protein 1 [Kalmusia sp. IMI 367209]|nr:sister chromatid cohesion protein 1 [Kalmusia sp. IMI 367209]